jgi:glycerophosphoryl diester phosphodiesterase
VNLLRQDRVLRIGHRGAPALAPENTLESISAAIDWGVDLVEIDVIAKGGSLRLAHSASGLTDASPTLREALELVGESEAGVILDLKNVGIEAAAVEAIRDQSLLERTVICSFHPASLRTLKRVEPGLTTGLAYPLDRIGIAERRAFQPLIRAGLAGLRRILPARITGMLERARADAATLHWGLVSRRLVERCHDRGAAVLAWTVEDESALGGVLAAGVDGVIANDPRLLHV